MRASQQNKCSTHGIGKEDRAKKLTAGDDQLPQESAKVTSGSGHSSPNTAGPSPFNPSVFTCQNAFVDDGSETLAFFFSVKDNTAAMMRPAALHALRRRAA